MGGQIDCVCHDTAMHSYSTMDCKVSVEAAEPCNHKRKMVRLLDLNYDLPALYADHGCSINEFVALRDRHLVELRRPCPKFLDKCYEALQELIPHFKGITKMTSRELLASRPPRMRKRYGKALGLDLKPTHSSINLFVKFEKKENPEKPPRAIQYRATPYTARLAKYIIPIEKLMYQGIDGVNHGYRIVAKGLNAIGRGELITSMYNHYEKPYVYLIDHSKFDSAVGPELLKLEHWFYNSIFKDPFLKYLLKQQRNNIGRSRNGLFYRCVARRMSGDTNTAIGNCVINYAILRGKFGDKAIIILDGDDSVVFMPHHVEADFSDTGMTSKVNVVRNLHEIEFCQSMPVTYGDKVVMCREPIRAVNRALYRLGSMPSNWRDYMATIGIGEGLCSPGMPILSILAKKFRSYGGEYKWYFSDYRLNTFKCSQTFEYPDVGARVDFAMCFDIDTYQQRLMEQIILAAVLNKSISFN